MCLTSSYVQKKVAAIKRRSTINQTIVIVITGRSRASGSWNDPSIYPLESTRQPESTFTLESSLNGVQWKEYNINCSSCNTTCLETEE